MEAKRYYQQVNAESYSFDIDVHKVAALCSKGASMVANYGKCMWELGKECVLQFCKHRRSATNEERVGQALTYSLYTLIALLSVGGIYQIVRFLFC